jgi:hypothetical protein
MDAGAQDLVRFADIGVGELRFGKTRLHSEARLHAAGIEQVQRVETLLDAPREVRQHRRLRLEDRYLCAHSIVRADQGRVA